MLKPYGFSLLEILVALFILSISLLGLDAAMLQTAIKSNEAFYFYVASTQAENAAEYLHMHAAFDQAYHARLLKDIKQQLPNGGLSVAETADGYRLNISWGFSQAVCHQSRARHPGCLSVKIRSTNHVLG